MNQMLRKKVLAPLLLVFRITLLFLIVSIQNPFHEKQVALPAPGQIEMSSVTAGRLVEAVLQPTVPHSVESTYKNGDDATV